MTDSLSRPDVSIVFTHWNVRDMLRDCLRSVKEKTVGLTYEIIIVDDGSTDGSVEMIRSEFPEVKLVANEKNIGVAKSYNKGAALVTGRYMQMLNTDMVLVNNAVKILLDFMESHPEAAACAGKLRNRDMTTQVSYGHFPSFSEAVCDALALPMLFPFLKWPVVAIAPDEKVTNPMEAEYLSGADMMIRKEVLDRIGFMDERYTSYCEETDFCYRIKHEAQSKLFYVPQAEIIHFGGQSFSKVPEYQYRLVYSGFNKFLTKHHGALYAFATRCFYALKGARRWLVGRIRYTMAPTENNRSYVIQAGWQFKYSLFPQEGRM
jgi:GT2 family glycosyltransferase